MYNPNLQWQYTNQTDIGIEAVIKGTRIAVSGFYHRTNRSYMARKSYTPFTYLYTPVSSIENAIKDMKDNHGIDLAAEDRRFSIDPHSGLVTMSDATGAANGLLPDHLDYVKRNTYIQRSMYANAQSPIHRYGLEWVIDFAQIKPIQTTIRLDGSYSYYKGLDEMLFPDIPLGVNSEMSNKQPYQYIGYYRGSDATSTGYAARASVSNGSLSKQLNLNATLTTHIPKIRMIVSLRVESTIYSWRRSLSELSDGTRGYMLDDNNGFFGKPYDGSTKDKFIIIYPEYYSTWDKPDELRPFQEEFIQTKIDCDRTEAEYKRMENDPNITEEQRLAKYNEMIGYKNHYSDLSKLVVRSNYAYTMNPNRLSAYYSANLSITKEIGDHVSLSFYANNFFQNMGEVRLSQTGLEESLFSSSYIPSFYYGLSLRLKL